MTDTPKSNNSFEYDLKFGQEFEHKLGQILANKKVICTIHHEVPWKFDKIKYKN